MKQRAAPIAVSGLLLGLIFDWFFYDKAPGVSVFLYTFLILSFTGFFMWQFNSSVNKALYWLVPLTLFFSFMVFVRASPLLAFINICLVLYLLLMIVRVARSPQASFSELTIQHYASLALKIPLAITQRALQFFTGALSNRRAPKSSALPVIRGLLISLPILFLFALLLSSADMVFQRIMGSLFDFQVDPELVSHALLIGFTASLCIGAFALIFMTPHEPEPKQLPDGAGLKLGATEASVILGSVGSLFLLFVLIQLAYLFGGADQVVSTGFTYAEYARKGFFELIAVAAISLGLILTIQKTVSLQTVSQKTTFKWLCGILFIEVLVIMLSAHMRLNLYEEAYGFTTLRLWSHMFILWLAVAFGLLALYITKERREQQFALQLFVSVLGFFALMNIINPDAFIARQNVNRFQKTGKIDTAYLHELSEDATPEIVRLLTQPNGKVQNEAANALYFQSKHAHEASEWQSVNAAKERAKQLFRIHDAQIDAGRARVERESAADDYSSVDQ